VEILSCDHIHLKANDVQKTSKWYCNVLGGKVIYKGSFRGSDVCYVNIKGTNFVIFGLLDKEKGVMPASINPRFGLDHFGFQVKNLKETIEELRGKNVSIIEEPWAVRPGVSIAYIEGPDKVRIELTQRN
jgi:catechol 2,3-dioxygenase-like lactoylglutathione lyase family enzyme